MTISDAELLIDFQLKIARFRAGLPDDAPNSGAVYRNAEFAQACAVCDALRDLSNTSVSLSGRFSNSEIAMYLSQGLGRRSKFMWLSLRELLRLIHPSRTQPLSIEAAETASKDLNEIYIDIRGGLDNLAWCLLTFHMQENTNSPTLAPKHVDIFGSKFQNTIANTEFSDFVNQYANWSDELKSRRDPVAHRIPLSVLPALQDDETINDCKVAMVEFTNANNAALTALLSSSGSDSDELVAKAEALREKLLGIGKFHPFFAHNPSLGAMKIYPTVPEDIGRFVIIGRGILRLIGAKAA